MSANPAILAAVLGHEFQDIQLLRRALTHKSRIFERPAVEAETADNEQLEFLGDAILGFLVSDALVRLHTGAPEGRLSKLKAHLVSEAHLYLVAQRLTLGDYLILGRGEEMSGGRLKRALLADALEAVIAALYLDGGIEVARSFVCRTVLAGIHDAEPGAEQPVTDFKSALQEMAQALKLPQPRYVIVKEHGPEHAKTFTVEVRLGKEIVCQAEGCTKKAAGQKAAEQILKRLAESNTGQ